MVYVVAYVDARMIDAALLYPKPTKSKNTTCVGVAKKNVAGGGRWWRGQTGFLTIWYI